MYRAPSSPGLIVASHHAARFIVLACKGAFDDARSALLCSRLAKRTPASRSGSSFNWSDDPNSTRWAGTTLLNEFRWCRQR